MIEYQPQSLFTTLWALLATYLLGVFVYRVWFHPLAKYPGPFFARFTDIYPMLAMFKMTRCYWQDEMIQKYGSPVRVSTNQLFFADMKSWVDIYGQSSAPCLKEPGFYDQMTATGATSVFNATSKVEHARVRRLLSHAFSLSALLKDEALVQKKVDELDRLVFAPAARSGQSVDIFGKMMCNFLDISSHFSYGESFNTLSGRGEISHADMDCFFVVIPVQAFLPFLRYVPIPRIQEAYRSLGRLVRFVQKSVGNFQAEIEKQGDQYAKGTFLRNLIDARDDETGGSKLSFEDLVENTIIFLLAGSDTTAITSMYLMWEVGRRPELKKKLVEEIRSAFPNPDQMPNYEQASQLTYLNACIEETLRLWGPFNVGFPRVSPGKQIGGVFVPAGTVVANVAYSTHRDPNYFPNPLEFVPERWLNASSDMKAMAKPFGHGPRNCIGKHLAEIGIHLTLTRLYQLYDIGIDPCMTEEMMRQKDRGAAGPWAGKFVIIPKPAGKA
ncbi:hypothetical protein H2204_011453 [Knufia peltigerae]|uniref:Cytochrome P450 n=1 Tax=Knufia peltigerae TaxID=1002370 RepID=A0AA38XVF2_9EURO|nr:hypothetical protein H2204_011453 [Knufia peltigerae]